MLCICDNYMECTNTKCRHRVPHSSVDDRPCDIKPCGIMIGEHKCLPGLTITELKAKYATKAQ